MAAAALFCGIAVFLADYLTVSRPAFGPMVQLVRPDGFTVVWWSSAPQPCELVIGDTASSARRITPRREGDERFVAVVSGLRNGDSLDYRIVQRSRLGFSYRVASGRGTLQPAPDQPLRFVAVGDTGVGTPEQYDVAREIAAVRPQLVIHMGDLIYPSGEWSDYGRKFFEPFRTLLPNVPFYACIGNHDAITDDGRPLLTAFELPRNGPEGVYPESAYWFDFGPARFLTFNSCDDEETLRRNVAPWIEKVFSDASPPWRVVWFHHPPYTGSKHPPDERIQRAIVPALERAEVDVVLCGHNHLYERTKGMRGGRAGPHGDGTCYIVTGGGGQSLYAESASPPDYIAASYDADHSFALVELSAESLRLRQISRRGRLIDDWTLGKTERRATTAPR